MLLKECTKCLEICGEKGGFGAIAKVIPVFEYLLSVYENRHRNYDDIIHDQHDEAPEDHSATNLCAAILKDMNHYNKFDFSPAYYTATNLPPRYRYHGDSAWAEKPKCLELSISNSQASWAQYKSLLSPRTRTKVVCNKFNDAINSIVNSGRATYNNCEDNKYKQWKRCELHAEKGHKYTNNPIEYWVELRDRYSNLSNLELDVLSIPASSAIVSVSSVSSVTCSSLAIRVYNLSFWPQYSALEGRKKMALVPRSDLAVKSTLIAEQMDNLYGIDTWDDVCNHT